MRNVDLNNLSGKDLLDHDAISKAFKKYLMDVLGYDEGAADFVVKCDFETPYNAPFVLQDYEGDYTVDGKKYSVRFCYTEFRACGLFHLAEKEPFEFYTLFDLETLPDNTVGSYQNAKKLYLI